jgi:hypothetical protein
MCGRCPCIPLNPYLICLEKIVLLGKKRARGIEPRSLAWKAKVLPLNYARIAVEWLTITEPCLA